jgi:SAM-dependent methyltransferase
MEAGGGASALNPQTWSAEDCARNARFVTELGAPVLQLLAPRPGERILDLGCGDGALTRKIAGLGCSVVGLDSSAELAASARKLGLAIVERSATEMEAPLRWNSVRNSMRCSATPLCEVRSIALIPRPTPIARGCDGMAHDVLWLLLCRAARGGARGLSPMRA